MKVRILVLIALFLLPVAAPGQKKYRVASPDGNVVVDVSLSRNLTWKLTFRGQVLLDEAPLSLETDRGSLGAGMRVKKAVLRHVDTCFETPLYTRSAERDVCNELVLQGRDGYDVVFRAYDEGAAYRFVPRFKEELTVLSEKAVFRVGRERTAYIPYVRKQGSRETQFFNTFENTYAHTPVSGWEEGRLAFLPLTVEAANGIKLCITEADLRDYPGMYLCNQEGGRALRGVFAGSPAQVDQGGHNQLQGLVRSRHNYLAKLTSPHKFPWRVIAIAKEDRQLAESDLTWRLAAPAAAGDWSWVKPGKVAWDWWNDWNISGVDFKSGVNNDTYKHYIDFASEHGIEYVILDEGWAVNKQADLMQVVPEIDLPMLCDYAKQKNVGLILWAGYWAFNRDMEGVCKHYSAMGIKGWKIDFMDRDDDQMVKFYEKAAATAAKYHMLVDFHGAYKPTGLQRTYPNILNFEGIHGLEQMKWSGPEVDQVTYDVTVPFTRLVAGPADYTQGAMRNATRSNYYPCNSEPMSQGTRCHQLAEYIVFDAPLTMLCDSPSNYRKEEECAKFIASVPTVWDETIALQGKIAEYVVVARRSGNKWYVGALGNWDERDLVVDLSRLGVGAKQGEVYVDGVNADRKAQDYKHEQVSVNGTWKVHLAPGGGAVLVL